MIRFHLKIPSELHFRQGKLATLAWIVGSVFTCMSTFAVAQRAILIGVSQFDHLPIKPLEGPPNDVALMASALQSIGVLPQKIIQLTDAADPDFLPRRANILRVLSEQARLSKPGETVIVYFSGHGAQIPQPLPVAKGRWVEPDGLDEVFLTRDTKLWDKRRQRVEGALLDDEIGDAFATFTKKGIRVWAIFDTCHAGDMARSAPHSTGEVIWRGIDAAELGVPSNAAITTAKSSMRERNKSRVLADRRSGVLNTQSEKGALVAFYASQPDEASPEELYRYPIPGEFKKIEASHGRFGIFTWELAAAIKLRSQKFSELANAISLQYRERPFPTPQYEGNLTRRLF